MKEGNGRSFVSRPTFHLSRLLHAPQIGLKIRTGHEEGRRLVVRVPRDFQSMFHHQNGHVDFLPGCELKVRERHSQLDNVPAADRGEGPISCQWPLASFRESKN